MLGLILHVKVTYIPRWGFLHVIMILLYKITSFLRNGIDALTHCLCETRRILCSCEQIVLSQ